MEIEKLLEGLKKLSGRDILECEQIERRRGNMMPMISFSAGFQLRIAALALGTNPGELEDLPAKKLNMILLETANFLLGNSEEEMPEEKLEK